MKILLILAILVTYTSTLPASNFYEPPFETNEEPLNETGSSIIPNVEVDESTITYWYYSKEDPSNGIVLNRYTVEELEGTSFNTSRDTIFMVHGWQNTNESFFATTVRNAVLRSLDVNLIYVDWSIIANQTYIVARASVSAVGINIAEFIKTLESTFGLSLSNLTLVGHSLGAHVVGYTGAALDGGVAVIVGLDPALPLFLTSGPEERLDTTDAQFVQVIHTNGGLKGILIPIGHADYYPNGGSRQPGCGIDLQGSCAHNRAHEFYAESLSSDKFVAVSCPSAAAFAAGSCRLNATSVMGTYNIDKSASGRYYLHTNDRYPFAQG